MHADLPTAGACVWIRQQRWRVEGVRREDAVVRLEVAGRGRRCTFLLPFDRPSATPAGDRYTRVSARHACARLARLVARSGTELLGAALDARIDVLPHQLEPALAILAGARRVLIADEVGLGKTIQAGLIAAELQRRQPALRTLLLVPASLRAQWIDELRVRFDLSCLVADADQLARLARFAGRGENPWHGPGIWIASLDYLKQPHVLETLPLRAWDLLIVDEAHGTCGESARHAAADAMARRSRRVVLLTATPHSGDDACFRRLIDLGALPCASDRLVTFRRMRHDVGLAGDRRVRWHGVRVTADEARLFEALMAFERMVLSASGDQRRDGAILLLSVFRKRALSTTAALAASLDRRIAWLDSHGLIEDDWTQPALRFERDEDDASPGERASLAVDLGLDVRHERAWLVRLRQLAGAAAADESKLRRIDRLVDHCREPVVIFTEFRDSLARLAERLAPIRSLAVIHGGLTPDDQSREITAFLEGRASVLLATDVASQGLNLQARARWIVSLELPWNPARLEQRAGRVDRIGQRRPVHATLLIARHPAESRVLQRLARRTLSAQRMLGPDTLRGAVPDERDLGACILAGDDMPLSPRPQPEFELCRNWRRPARWAARQLVWRRALVNGRRWTGDETNRAGTTLTVRLPRLRALLQNDSLFVFTVPINDASGLVVERHIVAVRARVETEIDVRALTGIARSSAARSKATRVRRLRNKRRALSPILIDREQMIAALLARLAKGGELQAGLLDRRAERSADLRTRESADLKLDLDARVREIGDRAQLEIGRPALELIFVARR